MVARAFFCLTIYIQVSLHSKIYLSLTFCKSRHSNNCVLNFPRISKSSVLLSFISSQTYSRHTRPLPSLYVQRSVLPFRKGTQHSQDGACPTFQPTVQHRLPQAARRSSSGHPKRSIGPEVTRCLPSLAHRCPLMALDRYLNLGAFSDCTIICDGKTRRAHKAFLSRIPRFSSEALENQDAISFSGFEIYEVMWLLQWVYHHKPGKICSAKERVSHHHSTKMSFSVGQKVDANTLATTNPTESGLNSCVRLAQIAKFYQVQDLEKAATASLKTRCDDLMKMSSRESKAQGIAAFLDQILVLMGQTFGEERNPSTSDEVRWLVCKLVQKYKIPFHGSYSFCKTLRTLDPHLRERCAVDGCENCAWVESAA